MDGSNNSSNSNINDCVNSDVLALHSFPTRRSSDLKITVEAQGEILQIKEVVNKMVDQLNAFAGERVELVHHLVDRSEEHTSELQSQFHLVCRLLLEKKKWCLQ